MDCIIHIIFAVNISILYIYYTTALYWYLHITMSHSCRSRTVNESLLEQTAIDTIADEILRIRDMRKQSEVDSVIKDEQMKQINDLQDFIKNQPTTVTEFDEVLVKRLIGKITVYLDYFTVEFRSGITINIEA